LQCSLAQTKLRVLQLAFFRQRDFFVSQPKSASSATQPASDSTAGAAEQLVVNIAATEAEQSSGSAARSSGSAERPANHSADSSAERPGRQPLL